MTEILARFQFYFTVGFHYLFPPVSIGMAWIIFYIMTRYKKTGDELYRVMARFWIKIFALVFAVGVATGITMEFQFGTNWSEYSRYVGDIFGAPLAAEGVLAFFLESTFLGMLIFGWDRLSTKVHVFSALMVAVGSSMSALWIIIANSWQQTPAGYKIENGRSVLTNFWEAALNPSFVERFTHVLTSAIATGAFAVLSISVYYIIKGKHLEFAKKSFSIALTVGLITSWGQLFLGHASAVQVWKTQPIKMATFEGQFETEKNAGLSVFGLPIAGKEKTYFDIRIPGMLSILLGGSKDTEVKGLKDFPKDEWPPLLLTSISYHIMIGLGTFMILLTTFAFILLRMGKLYNFKLLLYALLPAILYPTIANQAGWISAEVGRQPWIVYGLLRTSDGVSTVVPWYQIVFSLLLFMVVYSLLAYAFTVLLWKKIKTGPQPIGDEETREEVAS